MFVSTSDHRIFLWNLSFRVCLLLKKNILGTKIWTFMRNISLRAKEKFISSYISFSFYYCQLLWKPVWASKHGSTYIILTVLLVEILKEISRERNPLKKYLSMQEDLFFNTNLIVRSIKFQVIFRMNTLY